MQKVNYILVLIKNHKVELLKPRML